MQLKAKETGHVVTAVGAYSCERMSTSPKGRRAFTALATAGRSVQPASAAPAVLRQVCFGRKDELVSGGYDQLVVRWDVR